MKFFATTFPILLLFLTIGIMIIIMKGIMFYLERKMKNYRSPFSENALRSPGQSLLFILNEKKLSINMILSCLWYRHVSFILFIYLSHILREKKKQLCEYLFLFSWDL